MSRKDDSILNTIAAAVANWPGLTGAELSAKIGIPSAYRRLSEVARLGLVKKSSSRPCSVTGRKASTWEKDDSPQKQDLRPGETQSQMRRRMQARIDDLVNENEKLRQMLEIPK